MKVNTSKSYSKNYYILLSVIFIGYLVFGFSENIKGPAIPRIQTDFSLNEMQIGILLALNSLGYLLACSFTGVLTKKFGIRFSNLIAFGTMALSGVFIFLSVNYPTLSASYFLMYIGNGILEIALGILAAKVFTKNTGMMMNLAHFFYGLSSTIAPMVATGIMKVYALDRSFSWHEVYLIMLSLSVIPLIMALFTKFPEDDIEEEENISFKEYTKDPAAWMLVVILSFGVISELAVGGWLVNFLEKVYKWNINASSGLLSAFFFAFTLSRLLLGPFTDKIGLTKSLVIFSGASGIITLMGVIVGQSAAFLFALAGVGIAPIYPTVMALLSKRYSNNSSTAVSFTVTLMGIGSVIGNFLVGGIIDLFKNIFTKIYGVENGLIIGMKAGYAFVGVCALLCSISSMILYNLLKKQNQII
ncbi:fucose permease [Clostridium pascui]|uniref:MFS transporter n=1 Tax=Clostridium pascui TaxID=46609 RepID=UPI00195A5C14|nr:MFS transporter [Clostridium pascui]MBM7871339.1 fucose permease [Clostridium pascui]